MRDESTSRLPKRPADRLAVVAPYLLFALALAVRLTGLQWGLPSLDHWYSYHPDERQIAVAVNNLNIFDGDFNPNFFNYPSLYIYLVYVAHLIGDGLKVLSGPTSPAELIPTFLRNVMLAGRFVTALFGAATVPLAFAIARRIGNVRAGVLAALLLALLPGHVQHSHFATVDVPATFFVTLALWLSVRALEDGRAVNWRHKQLLWAAFVAGLAAATKYNAGLVIIAPLLTLWLMQREVGIDFRADAPHPRPLSPPGERGAASITLSQDPNLPEGDAALPSPQVGRGAGGEGRKTLATVLSIISLLILGFLLGCPFSVFDFGAFWGDCRNSGVCYELLVHPRQGHGDAFIATGNGWWYHLTFNLPFAMTWPILLAALAGLVLVGAAWRVRPSLPLLAWCAIYLVSLGFSQVRFLRYTLPILPVLCVFAALLALWLPQLAWTPGDLETPRDVRRVRHISAGFSGLLLVFALIGTIDAVYPFVAPDPRDQAAQWLKRQAGSTATIGLLNQPWFWTPPLSPQDAPPGSGQSIEASPDGRFRFAITGFDAATLADAAPEYFVLNEFEWRDVARLNDAAWLVFRQRLDADYELAARFQNQPPIYWPGRAFVPHDWLYTNPEVLIYRKK